MRMFILNVYLSLAGYKSPFARRFGAREDFFATRDMYYNRPSIDWMEYAMRVI